MYMFLWHILVLGLGIIVGYFGVATACAEDIRRKIQDAAECWETNKNLPTFVDNIKSILIYTMQLKELSSLLIDLPSIVLTKAGISCQKRRNLKFHKKLKENYPTFKFKSKHKYF